MISENTIRCVPGDGLGNRFLLVMEGDVLRSGHSLSGLALELCGKEIDGLLTVSAPGESGVMRVSITNRDGSDGGVCLNGLRVAACWTGAEEGCFEMNGKKLDWRRLEEDVFELHLRPEDLPGEIELLSLQADGREGVSVPFWNPHAIFPVDDVEQVDLESLSQAVRKQTELFPQGVNVEIVAPFGAEGLAMRVNDRGVGETQACGSAAVAVALLAWLEGEKRPIGVAMEGGILALSPSDIGGIFLAGKANIEASENRVLRNP
ncbi:MAG: diaminopimelate epimerase [Planctomycetota bacterium]|nr:diaminopimelate epimerase [Planctomycetota bacterium]